MRHFSWPGKIKDKKNMNESFEEKNDGKELMWNLNEFLHSQPENFLCDSVGSVHSFICFPRNNGC